MEVDDHASRTPPREDLTRLEATGPHSTLRAGTWTAQTHEHDEFGSSIAITFSTARRVEESRVKADASKLELGITGLDRKSFLAQNTQGKCGFGEDLAPEIHLVGDGLLCFCQGGNAVFRLGTEGMVPCSKEEGALILQGVPSSQVKEVLAAQSPAAMIISDSEGSTPAHSRPQSASLFKALGANTGSGELEAADQTRPPLFGQIRPPSAGQTQARTPSAGFIHPYSRSSRAPSEDAMQSRPSSAASEGRSPAAGNVGGLGSGGSGGSLIVRPGSSRRSRGEIHRPSSGSGRPYSASRPSSHGSIRHTVGIDDIGVNQQEMRSMRERGPGDIDDIARQTATHATQANLLIID